MTWVILSVLGAVGTAVHYALIKQTVTMIPVSLVAAFLYLITSLFLFAACVVFGIQPIDSRFFFAAFMTISINIIATQLLYTSLKTVELSLSSALFTLSPIVLVISSVAVLHESPSPLGLMGILIVVAGLYQLNLNTNRDLLAPFKYLATTPALRNTVIVALLFGVSAAYDKQTVLYAGPYLSGALVYLILGLFFLCVSIAKFKQKTLPEIKKQLPLLLLTGIVLTLSSIVINIALTLQIASYVFTLKRLSVIVSLLLGVFFFKEKFSLRKLFAILLVWIGSVCIILG